MTVETFLRVAPKLPIDTSVMLRGDHGIGKSQLVRQLALLLGFSLDDVIDRRLSQMSEGDMIGLPTTDGNVTRFNPPDWYMQACKQPKILFLDELNRATPEVGQASFQIVLDRELNGFKLHPKTRVFSAVNTNPIYTVNEIDPALLDRFWVIDLDPKLEDWVKWANTTNAAKSAGKNVHQNVIDFVQDNEKWLRTPKNANPGDVNTSPRSWERLSDALTGAGIADEPNNPDFYPICLGYVGTEATIAFHGFIKNLDNQVTGEEILKDYAKAKAKINRLGQERLNIAIEKLAEHVNAKCKKLTEKQGNNLRDFMADLPGEQRLVLWQKLTEGGIDKVSLIKDVHKHTVSLIMEVFGVPMGSDGKGISPTIPDFLKDKTESK